MESEVKQGLGIIAAVAVASALLGGAVSAAIANATHRSAVDDALTELRGTGNVPGTANGQESSGSFIPSDSPPACLPNGTVTYEIYDEAANMRYWVFRWPEGGGPCNRVHRCGHDAGGGQRLCRVPGRGAAR